jgi:hypothetical protein
LVARYVSGQFLARSHALIARTVLRLSFDSRFGRELMRCHCKHKCDHSFDFLADRSSWIGIPGQRRTKAARDFDMARLLEGAIDAELRFNFARNTAVCKTIAIAEVRHFCLRQQTHKTLSIKTRVLRLG